MLELRQLHLKLALMRSSALGKNIEYQARTVEYTALEFGLQVSLLAGTQRMIEHDDFSTVCINFPRNLIELTRPHKRTWIRGTARTHDIGCGVSTR